MEYQTNIIHPRLHLGEPYFTLPQAASKLGLPVSLLRRAVKRGLIPSYQPFGQRVRVCLPEVVAAIASSQTGGQSDE